jgi:uncharacterized protein
MQIWVDADACPKVIKEILYRAAKRSKTTMILVANQPLVTPPSVFIRKRQVGAGFDVADNEIVQHVEKGDLVITADIPLADLVVDKGATALDPRGVLYTKTNIKQRLSLRHFHAGLRGAGVLTGGPDTLNKKEAKVFADCLDNFLNSH